MIIRKALALVFYAFTAVILVYAVIPFFYNPDPFHFQVSLPERAEVLPAERVQPGTFKLELPWDEIRDRAKTAPSKTIVSYGSGSYGSARVEAYVPRGDSTFYYAMVKRVPDWPYAFRVGRVERTGDQFTAYPDWSRGVLFGSVLVTLICGFIGLLVDRRIALTD